MPESKSPAAGSDELMTEKEAAVELDVTPNTLYLWRTKKIGPPYVRIRNRWVRYRKSDVIDFKQKTIVCCAA